MHAAAAAHLLAWLARRCPAPARRPRVLDIGSGSGYLTHVLALLAGPAARVVGLDHLPALRALGEANMAKSPGGRALLAAGRVRFRLGDGRKGWREEGEEEGGEWDVIHVGASAAEVHPELLAGLARGGRMFIPVDDGDGEGGQSVWTVDRDADGRVTRERLFGVRYVPLTDAPRE